MKKRKGFVSNSSSSSFIIPKYYLSKEQIDFIKDHNNKGKEFGLDCTEEYNSWTISEHESFIHGTTSMDNFDMYTFFDKIGISDEYVKWGDGWDDIENIEDDLNSIDFINKSSQKFNIIVPKEDFKRIQLENKNFIICEDLAFEPGDVLSLKEYDTNGPTGQSKKVTIYDIVEENGLKDTFVIVYFKEIL